MDYQLDGDQLALVDLSTTVLRHAGETPYEPADAPLHDDSTWRSIGAAGLVGVAARERSGGADLGALGAGLVASECGRACVTHPVSAAIVGARALDLIDAPVVTNEMRTAAAAGALVAMTPVAVGVPTSLHQLRLDSAAGRLSEEEITVESGADLLVVWVSVDGNVPGVLLADPTDDGVRQTALNTAGGPLTSYRLDRLRVQPANLVTGQLVADARKRVEALRALLTCAELCGLAAAALRMTAEYAGTRRQFARPIGTFQAVSNRLGDGYVDVESMTWSMLRAADSQDRHGGPDRALAIARVWACEGADRVLATAQHVHGGLGVDIDYPLHALYLRTRQLLLAAGGAERSLAELGELIAAGAR